MDQNEMWEVWVVVETYSWHAFSPEYVRCWVFRSREGAQAFAEELHSKGRNVAVESHIYMD